MKVRIEDEGTGIGLELSLESIGEGYGGDYQPDDPYDRELLRMDVAITQVAADRFEHIGEDGEEGWFVPDKCSYCTRIPASILPKAQGVLAAEMAGVLWRVLMSGVDLRHTAAQLSWSDDRGLPAKVS